MNGKFLSVEIPCNPTCRYEVRKWQHGNYTLVHDTDLQGSEFALDAALFCLCKGLFQFVTSLLGSNLNSVLIVKHWK